MNAEEKGGKIVRGVYVDRDLPEYTKLYNELMARAQASAKAEGPGPVRRTPPATEAA